MAAFPALVENAEFGVSLTKLESLRSKSQSCFVATGSAVGCGVGVSGVGDTAVLKCGGFLL